MQAVQCGSALSPQHVRIGPHLRRWVFYARERCTLAPSEPLLYERLETEGLFLTCGRCGDVGEVLCKLVSAGPCGGGDYGEQGEGRPGKREGQGAREHGTGSAEIPFGRIAAECRRCADADSAWRRAVPVPFLRLGWSSANSSQTSSRRGPAVSREPISARALVDSWVLALALQCEVRDISDPVWTEEVYRTLYRRWTDLVTWWNGGRVRV